MRNAAGRTLDVVAQTYDSKKKYIVRASRRGYVRVYVGRPMLKSLISIFSGPDIKVDLMNREIGYKPGFEDLVHQLQSTYSEIEDVRDEARGIEYSLKTFISMQM